MLKNHLKLSLRDRRNVTFLLAHNPLSVKHATVQFSSVALLFDHNLDSANKTLIALSKTVVNTTYSKRGNTVSKVEKHV